MSDRKELVVYLSSTLDDLRAEQHASYSSSVIDLLSGLLSSLAGT